MCDEVKWLVFKLPQCGPCDKFARYQRQSTHKMLTEKTTCSHSFLPQYARQFSGRDRGGAPSTPRGGAPLPHPGAKAPATHGRVRDTVHREVTTQGGTKSLDQNVVANGGGSKDLYCRSLPRPNRGTKSRLWTGHGTLGRESRPQNSIMGFFQRRQGSDQEPQGRKAVQVSCFS